jgi:probable rRNA maturation factor|tara:strand:+ start:549 stop:1016 length:468 start_codon:yes stop_codon:yes gene_type:complete
MIKADVLVNNKDWEKHIPSPNIYFKKKLKLVENKISIFKKNKLNFTILLSGDNEIKILNKKFRKKNKVTDILSFPSCEKKTLYMLMKDKKNNVYLGDLIINLNKIVEQSKEQSFNIVFDKIWIHGIVHLLGYRHESNKDFSLMQELENRIIKSIQ